MLDRIRSRAYGVLASRLGDRVAPVRWTKSAALYLNDVVGRPLAPADELARREAFEAKLRERRAAEAGEAAGATGVAGAGREAAPVVVFHLDKHYRELAKLEDALRSRDIPYQVRNIEGDEATISAVKLECKGYELPVVFIAGTVVGGLEQLINLDKRGELLPAVFGS